MSDTRRAEPPRAGAEGPEAIRQPDTAPGKGVADRAVGGVPARSRQPDYSFQTAADAPVKTPRRARAESFDKLLKLAVAEFGHLEMTEVTGLSGRSGEQVTIFHGVFPAHPDRVFRGQLISGRLQGRVVDFGQRRVWVTDSELASDPRWRERDFSKQFCERFEPPETDHGGQLLASQRQSDVAYSNNGYEFEVPVFSSLPGAEAVMYLDFDGETVIGTDWNTADHPEIVAGADPLLDASAIAHIWAIVSEDYAPFAVNVTTDYNAYLNAAPEMRQRCIVTPTDDWFLDLFGSPASGVAVVGSFGSLAETPCWVFTESVGRNAKYLGDAVAHELGHTGGLLHDGLTEPIPPFNTNLEYYRGHGPEATGWAPIMGTSFTRAIAQWSQGEYRFANRKHDDLAILGGVGNGFGFRSDDHGEGPLEASFLAVAGSTATGDGVIGTRTDRDVFLVPVGPGNVQFRADADATSPNLDIRLQVADAAGNPLAVANPVESMSASVQLALSEAQFVAVTVEGSGRGDPWDDGYSDYASLGRYSVSVTGAMAVELPIEPTVQVLDLKDPLLGAPDWTLTLRYRSPVTLDTDSAGIMDVVLSGLGGLELSPVLEGVEADPGGRSLLARYRFLAPGGSWDLGEVGSLGIFLTGSSVSNQFGLFPAPRELGQIHVTVPVVSWGFEGDEAGWTLEPLWEVGSPAGSQGDPHIAAGGNSILAYNLDGGYEPNLEEARFAVSPPVSVAGWTGLRLVFDRWLGIEEVPWAFASIEASEDGVNWEVVWQHTDRSVVETAWRTEAVSLSQFDGATQLWLRFGMGEASGEAGVYGGWNIDNVRIEASDPLEFLPGADWRYRNFGYPMNIGVAADQEDPDRDLLINLAEGAFRASPWGSSTAQAPVVDVQGKRLRICFRRDPGRTDLTYTVEVSGNMVFWQQIARSSGGAPMQKFGGAYSVTETELPLDPADAEVRLAPLVEVAVVDGTRINSASRRYIRVRIQN